MRTILPLGNRTHPTLESIEEESIHEVGEGSKTMYINDSSNLDTIPFDVEQIIDTDDNEDMY